MLPTPNFPFFACQLTASHAIYTHQDLVTEIEISLLTAQDWESRCGAASHHGHQQELNRPQLVLAPIMGGL